MSETLCDSKHVPVPVKWVFKVNRVQGTSFYPDSCHYYSNSVANVLSSRPIVVQTALFVTSITEGRPGEMFSFTGFELQG